VESITGISGHPNGSTSLSSDRPVNQASRIEKLSSELGKVAVTSSNFAAAAPEPLERLGAYQLRGVAGPQEIFAIPMLTGKID
jgi:class 3 adenylate cyclase